MNHTLEVKPVNEPEGHATVQDEPRAKKPTTDAPSRSPQTASEGVSNRLQSLQLSSGERRQGSGRSWPRRLLTLLIVLGIACGVGYVASQDDRVRDRIDTFRAPELDAVTVKSHGPAEISLSLAGFAVAEQRIKVSPKIAGTVEEVLVQTGDKVEAGQLLAVLDGGAFRADHDQAAAALELARSRMKELKNGARKEDLEAARAALEQAEEGLEYAQQELDRANRLKDIIAGTEYDAAVAAHKKAKSAVKQMQPKLDMLEAGARPEQIEAANAEIARAEALLKASDYRLENIRVVSPIAGTVLSQSIAAGEVVQPEMMRNGMFVIADLSHMQAEVEIQERDLREVTIGQPCRVIPDAYDDVQYDGRLASIEPEVDRQRGVVTVRVDVLNPDSQLLSEMNCRVEFINPDWSPESAGQVSLPASAVLLAKQSPYVFKIVDEKLVETDVAIVSEEESGDTVVTGDLKEGDIVLQNPTPFSGQDSLRDGQAVKYKLADEPTDE